MFYIFGTCSIYCILFFSIIVVGVGVFALGGYGP